MNNPTSKYQISDNEQLDINRWQELENTNPHYLAKLLEQRSSEIMPQIFKEAFAKGISITYRDPDYNNALIEEHPDGRRFILTVHFDDKTKRFSKNIDKELPQRTSK